MIDPFIQCLEFKSCALENRFSGMTWYMSLVPMWRSPSGRRSVTRCRGISSTFSVAHSEDGARRLPFCRGLTKASQWGKKSLSTMTKQLCRFGVPKLAANIFEDRCLMIRSGRLLQRLASSRQWGIGRWQMCAEFRQIFAAQFRLHAKVGRRLDNDWGCKTAMDGHSSMPSK